MKTYEDLIRRNGVPLEAFLESAITEHCSGDLYRTAAVANAYARRRNVTIEQYQKLLYTLSGKAVPDNYSANHKCKSAFFPYFVTQENAYLLGNGVTFQNPGTKERLGGEFDETILDAGFDALVMGVSFLFWNFDRVMEFTPLDFVPLYSEENGALSAGIRFWQIDQDKPLRATLYEPDGYTEYIRRSGADMEVLREKRTYTQIVVTTPADGMVIYDGDNYPTFPIIPLYANRFHQSELIGLREKIDCYDLIESGFANDVDDASLIYWTISNAGGMDDIDLAKFVERMKTVRAAAVEDDGAKAEAHTVSPPYEAREAALKRLETGLYRDAMALDVRQISAGDTTATQIIAAYEPLNNKVDQYEACVTRCIKGILAVAGIEDVPSYTRSKIVNQLEETQMVMTAAAHLDEQTLLEKLPWLTPEDVEAVLERTAADSLARFGLSGAGVDTNTAADKDGSGGLAEPLEVEFAEL